MENHPNQSPSRAIIIVTTFDLYILMLLNTFFIGVSLLRIILPIYHFDHFVLQPSSVSHPYS